MQAYAQLKRRAEKELKQLAAHYALEDLDPEEEAASAATVPGPLQPEDPLFDCLSEELSAEQSRRAVAREKPSQEEELRHYLQIVAHFKATSGIKFWSERLAEFPLLANIALDILAVPATTAPVERIFSQTGLCTGDRRDNLSDENLEMEVMIRVNRILVTQLLN